MKKKKDWWAENGYCPQHRKLRQLPLCEDCEWEQYCWPHTTGISSRHMFNSVWPSSWFLEHSFSEMPPSTFLKEQSSVCPLLRPLLCEILVCFLTAGSHPQKTSQPWTEAFSNSTPDLCVTKSAPFRSSACLLCLFFKTLWADWRLLLVYSARQTPLTRIYFCSEMR